MAEGAMEPVFLGPNEGERLSVVTDAVRVLADGAATGGRLFIFVETVPPGGGPPLHRHGRDDEFFYVLEGRFRFVMDGREFVGGAGAFVALPKGSVHAFANVGETDGRLLIITTPAGLEGPFRVASARGATDPAGLAEIFRTFDLAFLGPPLGKGTGKG